MTQFTPGPWEVYKLDAEPHKPDTYVLGRSSPHHWTGIGEVKLSGCEPGSPENEANARLIAAAPDLLAALDALLNACYEADAHEDLSEYVDGSLLDAAAAASAKARGES